MAYENNEKDYASKGVGTAGLTTGIIGTVGTAIATGILGGNGMGGLFGGNQNPSASPIYQLSQKDNEIALLNRDKILSDSILNLQATLSRIAVPMVPNYALAPGYGPAFVGPMPPPGYAVQPIVNGGATTTPTSTTTAQAA